MRVAHQGMPTGVCQTLVKCANGHRASGGEVAHRYSAGKIPSGSLKLVKNNETQHSPLHIVSIAELFQLKSIMRMIIAVRPGNIEQGTNGEHKTAKRSLSES
jgi:hypothetical protein